MKGRRLEDLPLRDEVDPRTEVWYQFCAEIDELLTDDYAWATDTLDGIRKTVEASRRVTDGQRRAIDNIRQARSRQEGFRRRYEGFGGRR